MATFHKSQCQDGKNVKNKDIRTLKDTSENHNTPKAHHSRTILSCDFGEQF